MRIPLESIGGLREGLEQLVQGLTDPRIPQVADLPELPPGEGAATIADGFNESLTGALRDLEAKQQSADRMIADYLAGENVETHQVMIAMEKAGIAFQTLAAVRTRALDAYQEIMRMQI
jgi:flagellar hook-basal body complex protein FliE